MASGPWNLEAGNSAKFVVEFLSSSDRDTPTTPSSGTLTVSYTNIDNVPQTDTIDMSLAKNFYTATWSSTNANYGIATWDVLNAAGRVTEGHIRVIERQTRSSQLTRVDMNLYDTRTQAAATVIASTVHALLTAGFATVGDLGAALYYKVGGPTTGGFQSADGAWWALAEPVLRPEMFSSTADTTAIQQAVDLAATRGGGTVQLTGKNYRAVKQGANAYCLNLHGPVSLVGEAPGNKNNVNAGTGTIISWGANVDSGTNIILWGRIDAISGAKISTIQFMPDGFTATHGNISGLTTYGLNAIMTEPSSSFGLCLIEFCTIGPTIGNSISISDTVGNWVDGRIENNQIWAGISGQWLGDNNAIVGNAFLGMQAGIDVGTVIGASTLLIQHNHGIPYGGGIIVRRADKCKILDNFFESDQPYSGAGGFGTGYICLCGDSGVFTHCEVRGNLFKTHFATGYAGVVAFINTDHLWFEDNVVGDDASVYPGVYFHPSSTYNYLGKLDNLGSLPLTGDAPGYNYGAVNIPIGVPVPLTLNGTWTAISFYEPATAKRDRDGTVHVTGVLHNGTPGVGQIMATLPTGYWPNGVTLGAAVSAAGVYEIQADSATGQISQVSAGSSVLSSINMTFQVSSGA